MSIISRWPKWFRDLYGGEWPRAYVAFDLETTGFSFDKDVITEIAHCLVEGGKVTDQLTLVLDWRNHPVVPDHWLRGRLNYLTQELAGKGIKPSVSYERMEEEGIEPEKALAFYLNLFKTYESQGIPMAAHNGYGFDEKMFHANITGFKVAPDFRFGDNMLFDTDCLAKADQAVGHSSMWPRVGDTLRTYFHRVRYARLPGVKSKLADYCFDRYGCGRFMKKETLHTAATDAYCVHLIMESLRHAGGSNDLAPVALPPGVTLPPIVRVQPPARVRRRGQRN